MVQSQVPGMPDVELSSGTNCRCPKCLFEKTKQEMIGEKCVAVNGNGVELGLLLKDESRKDAWTLQRVKSAEESDFIRNWWKQDQYFEYGPRPYCQYDAVVARPQHDLWSFGIVVANLLTGVPIFKENREDNICTKDDWLKLLNWSSRDFDQHFSSMETTPEKSLAKNFVSLLLQRDPQKRFLSCGHALEHPFLTGKTPKRIVGQEAEYDVFLSYRVVSDAKHIKLLHRILTQRGLRVYWDALCIRDGKPWEREFAEGLIASKIFVPFISRHAVNQPNNVFNNFSLLKSDSHCDNVLLEHRLAFELQDRGYIESVFPVCLGDAQFNQGSEAAVGDKVYVVRSNAFDDGNTFSKASFMTCTVIKFDPKSKLYTLQPDGNDPEFTLDMQTANEARRLFPMNHKNFNTRDDIDPGNIKKDPACWNPPDVCVAAVERKLCEHLSNNGMGTPYTPNKTVKSVLLDISNTQGMFMNGNSVDQIFACADRIFKLARPECASPISIPTTPTTGRSVPTTPTNGRSRLSADESVTVQPTSPSTAAAEAALQGEGAGRDKEDDAARARCLELEQEVATLRLSVEAAERELSTMREQPLVSSPMSAKDVFPSSAPPELTLLSAETVALRIDAIAIGFKDYHQSIIDKGYDGLMVSTFAGRRFADVSQDLQILGVHSQPLRDRIVVELNKLFDPQTYPIQTAAAVQPSTASEHQVLPFLPGDGQVTPRNRRNCSML